MGFTALSAALPLFRLWLHAPSSRLSLILLAWAVGNTVGYFGANALVDRIGSPRLLRAGLGAFAAGYLILVFVHVLTTWLLVLGLVGVGVSLIDVASARLVAHLHRREPARALRRVNVFFGLGAILGPLATALALRLFASPLPVFACLIALALAGLVTLGTSMTVPNQVVANPRAIGHTAILRWTWVWRLGLATFLYITAEVGFGTWVSPFAVREAHVTTSVAALFPMVFWGGLMVTRLVASAPQTRLRHGTVLVAGSVLGAVMSALALRSNHSPFALLLAAFLVGCSYGPLFPLFLAVSSRRAPEREGGIYGVLYIAVAIASLVVPWGEGQIFSLAPTLTLGITPLVSLFMALVLWIDQRAFEVS